MMGTIHAVLSGDAEAGKWIGDFANAEESGQLDLVGFHFIGDWMHDGKVIAYSLSDIRCVDYLRTDVVPSLTRAAVGGAIGSLLAGRIGARFALNVARRTTQSTVRIHLTNGASFLATMTGGLAHRLCDEARKNAALLGERECGVQVFSLAYYNSAAGIAERARIAAQEARENQRTYLGCGALIVGFVLLAIFNHSCGVSAL